ncbi:hypothetical protein [Actinomadura luteofluorescens]
MKETIPMPRFCLRLLSWRQPPFGIPPPQPVNRWTSPETDLANVAARAVTEATAAAHLATLPDFGTALIEQARSELARRAGECW